MKKQKHSLSDPATWVKQHGDLLFRYALVRVQRRDVAEDLVQETFISAIRGRDSFRGEASEIAWLKGILRHKVVDHYRRKSSDEVPTDDQLLRHMFDRQGQWRKPPLSWGKTADETVTRQDFWNILTRCLARLPESQASVFILREIDGRNNEELCKILSISPTNMWVRLHRARLRLRQCLEVNWFEKKERE